MSSIDRASIGGQPGPARTILAAGLIAGSLDITAACARWMLRGITPTRVLQSVASGLLGSASYHGGIPTALLGLLCHFTIAFGAAAVYYLASRRLAFLLDHALIAGALYGIAVYFFMDYVVLPLSRFPFPATWNPLSFIALAFGIPVHIVCIGLAIALSVRHFGRA